MKKIKVNFNNTNLDLLTIRAIRRSARFGSTVEEIANEFNLSEEIIIATLPLYKQNIYNKCKSIGLKKNITLDPIRQEKERIVTELFEKYPNLSVESKIKEAEKFNIKHNEFLAIKHRLGLRQTRYIISKPLQEKQQNIRDEYSTGLYSYSDLGKKYKLTRERIRQIVSDLHQDLKAAGKLQKTAGKVSHDKAMIFTNELLYVFGKAYKFYNKTQLTLEELTAGHYNLFGKNDKTKVKTLAQVRTKLFYLLYKSNNLDIKKISARLYQLTQTGVQNVEQLMKNNTKESLND